MAKVMLLTGDREIRPTVERVLKSLGLECAVANTAFEAACLVVEGHTKKSPFKIFLIDDYLCEFHNSYDPGSSFAGSVFVNGGQVISLTRSFPHQYQSAKEDSKFAAVLERLLRNALSRD